MSILSGYGKYKRYILTSEGYKLCSQWTSSNTVEMGDGNTAETNLGSIKGITDSLTATSSNIALSASAGNNLQNQVDTLNSNFVKSANWETLFEDNNGVAQGNGIYFDMKGYKVFAIQVSSESLIFVRLWTTDLQNISAGIPVLINNGTMWISVNRIIRIDSYSDHWHIQQLADFDTAGNSYSDGRKVYAIYGVK